MGTITKSLNLLNYFSKERPEIGLVDFKNLTGQDKATIHRHLTELVENGFLEQNPETRKYRLGATLMRLSAVRESTFPMRKIVTRQVTSLSESLGELVHASLIVSKGMSPLCYHDGGTGGTRVYFNEADMLPLHATASGITALAFGHPELLEKTINSRLVKYTDNTITDPEKINESVSTARRNGYVISDQSFEREVSSIAVPFFEISPYAHGTISLAVPTARMARLNENQLVHSLWATSRAISKDLGGDVPEHLSNNLAKSVVLA